MKRILLFLFLVPTLALSQVSSWRGSSTSTVRSSQFISSNNEMSSWRNSNPRDLNRPQETRPGSNILVRDPWSWNDWGWGWNRWNMWGAPTFGWNFWQPMWYWNDWGYRQPARVYVYENGKRDTIKGKKPIMNFGLHHTTNNQMGVFFTVGNRGYFVIDVNTTSQRDRSTFFRNGTIDKVDFPLISDLTKQKSLYVGAGKRFGRVGVHSMVGFANERILWRGRDQIGEITFPKSNQSFVTYKIGALKDYKNFTLKMDYDPVIKYGQFGLGFNF
jgi:hypothetical protein